MKTEHVFKVLIHITTFVLGLYTAWVLTILWGWFIFPQFGIVSPSLFAMAGLMLIGRLLTYSLPPLNSNNIEDMNAVFVYVAVGQFLLSTSALIAGWVYHLFA